MEVSTGFLISIGSVLRLSPQEVGAGRSSIAFSWPLQSLAGGERGLVRIRLASCRMRQWLPKCVARKFWWYDEARGVKCWIVSSLPVDLSQDVQK